MPRVPTVLLGELLSALHSIPKAWNVTNSWKRPSFPFTALAVDLNICSESASCLLLTRKCQVSAHFLPLSFGTMTWVSQAFQRYLPVGDSLPNLTRITKIHSSRLGSNWVCRMCGFGLLPLFLFETMSHYVTQATLYLTSLPQPLLCWDFRGFHYILMFCYCFFLRFYVCVLSTCIHMHHLHTVPMEVGRGRQISWVTGSKAPPCENWKLNPVSAGRAASS